MRIGVAATPEVALPTLDWLLDSTHEIALVISQPDRAAGRGQALRSSPVSAWAINHKLPLIQPASSEELVGKIEDLDCIVTIGYGVLLPESILKLPRYGFINLHFSILPAYRGAAPVQRAIENGEIVTGVSVFALDKGMDTGPVYCTSTISIDPTWRSQELFNELALIAPSAVETALTAISLGQKPTPQIGEASKAQKISKEEAQIDWNQSADVVLLRIRAFYPAPIAWSTWKGESFRVTEAKVSTTSLPTGEISVVDGCVNVGCGNDSAITLVSVIPSGKKEMPAIDWARGARLEMGSHFG
jgi:methionyl-tRNA formyltransferase